MKQKIYYVNRELSQFKSILKKLKLQTVFLVCDSSFKYLSLSKKLLEILKDFDIKYYIFDDFQPNPLYQSLQKGIAQFKKHKCDCIIAVGGGSAIDVAKCIKLYANADADDLLFKQQVKPSHIPFMAFPSTAGSGSEATKYAVIYYNGEKQSISSDFYIPNYVFFDVEMLSTLPQNQKKSTMLDALCHSIESFWSVNSNRTSQKYAQKSIKLILANYKKYLEGDRTTFAKMFKASFFAGKAINITQTTAGHAMSYKLTSNFAIPHGQAVAFCMQQLIPFVNQHKSDLIDPRGQKYFEKMLNRLSNCLGLKSFGDVPAFFSDFLKELDLKFPAAAGGDYKEMAASVNLTRLKNFPIKLQQKQIENLYKKIISE